MALDLDNGTFQYYVKNGVARGSQITGVQFC